MCKNCAIKPEKAVSKGVFTHVRLSITAVKTGVKCETDVSHVTDFTVHEPDSSDEKLFIRQQIIDTVNTFFKSDDSRTFSCKICKKGKWE